MPKLSGVFDIFENLESIPYEDIARWLKPAPQQEVLENYLANRIIYPQVTPSTLIEQEYDLAILREALRRNPIFYKINQKKIFIPSDFLQITPDIKKLASVFIDAYSPSGIVVFILSTGTGDKVLGSLVTVFSSASDTLHFELEGQNYKLKSGSLIVLPCPKEHCHVSFKSTNSKIFGKNELLFEIPGGALGLIIDGRLK